MTSLSSLRERVLAATGPDRELERDLWEAITGQCVHRRTHYVELEDDEREMECTDCGADTYGADKWSGLMSSLDAALALVEAKLPGWGAYLLAKAIRAATRDGVAWHEGTPQRMALALLSALEQSE